MCSMTASASRYLPLLDESTAVFNQTGNGLLAIAFLGRCTLVFSVLRCSSRFLAIVFALFQRSLFEIEFGISDHLIHLVQLLVSEDGGIGVSGNLGLVDLSTSATEVLIGDGLIGFLNRGIKRVLDRAETFIYVALGPA